MTDDRMKNGILPVQQIRDEITAGHIISSMPVTEAQLQPASMDLRLGTRGWRVRSSFLPGHGTSVAQKLDKFAMQLHHCNLHGDFRPLCCKLFHS